MLLQLNDSMEVKLEPDSIDITDNLMMFSFELEGSELVELLQLDVDEEDSISAGWFDEITVDVNKVYNVVGDLHGYDYNVEGDVTFRMINELNSHNSIFKIPLMIWDYQPDVKGFLIWML